MIVSVSIKVLYRIKLLFSTVTDCPIFSYIQGKLLRTPLGRVFRIDRDVVIKAIRNTPRALSWASTELKNDVLFYVKQCMREANSAEVLEYASDDLPNGGIQDFLIHEIVSYHNFHASGFMLAVGCSKLLPRTAKLAPIPSCHLGILSRGVETTTAITMLVADFVGVPYGEDLRLCNTSFDLLETHDAAEFDDDMGYDSGEASD